MTDHHDFADHHFDDDHHDPLPFGEEQHPYGEPVDHEPAWDDDAGTPEHHDLSDLSAEHDGQQDGQHDGQRYGSHDDAGAPQLHADETAADTAGTHPEISDLTGAGSGADGADAADAAAAVDVFPAPVDVGELPEPVDGFPWIDSGSLGLADIAAALHDADAGTDPVEPHELAEYAATDLPPGVDPWAALADSDDPATSALARWWAPEN